MTSEAKAYSFLVSFILIGLVFLLFSLFYKNGALICHQVEPRLPVTCELTESNAFVSSEQEFELLGARLAQDERTRSSSVPGQRSKIQVEERVYWVVLETNIGDVSMTPLMEKSTIVNSALNLENRVNNFIDNPAEKALAYYSWPSFYITWIPGLIGFVMVVLGIVLIHRIWRYRPENTHKFRQNAYN